MLADSQPGVPLMKFLLRSPVDILIYFHTVSPQIHTNFDDLAEMIAQQNCIDRKRNEIETWAWQYGKISILQDFNLTCRIRS